MIPIEIQREHSLLSFIKRVFGNRSIQSLNQLSDYELLSYKYIGKKTLEYIRSKK